MPTNSQAPCRETARRIREEIIPLLDMAVGDEDVVFQNPHMRPCWVAKDCKVQGCPAFHQEGNLRCWQAAGTYCGGRAQGQFVEKYASCRECVVYREACPTIVEELGEGINNLLFLIRRHKKRVEKQLEEIGYLNRELSVVVQNLDSQNRAIQDLVITDRLTGLYNRNYLFTVLVDEMARCDRHNYELAILMMDMDGFKRVNDAYGHLEGDRALAACGALLKGLLRKTDRCFRYGGDEFVAVMPETGSMVAYLVAERVRSAFEAHVFTANAAEAGKEVDISLTFSIGVACRQKGWTPEEMLTHADATMYRAKSEGRNRVVRYESDESVEAEP